MQNNITINRMNYIDNIRILVIILLFPFHTFRMFTSLEPFYVQGDPQYFCDVFIASTSIWFMNMLFVLAGISISFSLRKRTIKEFLKERITKLLIPFVFGVILTIPIQTFYAEKFHNHYEGGYIKQLGLFFTKVTDLSGYYGGFTPGHLWFLLFLFAISIFSLPVIIYVKKKGLTPLKKNPTMIRLIPWFFVIMIASIVEIGESIGQYMAYFLLGYLLLQRNEVMQILKKWRLILASVAIILCSGVVIVGLRIEWDTIDIKTELIFSAIRHMTSWITILSILGLGQSYLNFRNKISIYFIKNSFSIYFVHQTILVVIGFYVIKYIPSTKVQILLIMMGGFVCSIVACQLLKRIPLVRNMFGVVYRNKNIDR